MPEGPLLLSPVAVPERVIAWMRGQTHFDGHRFHGSALKPVWRSRNLFLIRWLMRKHKRLAGHKTRAAEMLKRLAQSQPGAFHTLVAGNPVVGGR